MNTLPSRRVFLRTTAAGLALAAAPGRLMAQGVKDKAVFAFVGCAHIHTPGFVNLLKERPDVTVKYVWDHQNVRAEKRAAELGAQVAKRLDVIWGDPHVDAVVICSETDRHPALVRAAAKAGKHMFVEKPLGFTSSESIAMARDIEKAKLLFTTGYFMR
ncbi:MAG: Gfo/Idh/MocA family oxidoreductase, partial [Verrucomicrobiales bacterium]|nr:Gfo/Idh/MocA family oxidoreductase [Verrucomicrobiales bacterium]